MKTKKGMVLVEFCTSLFLSLTLIFLGLAFVIFLLWQNILFADMFFLSRAHLYGNNPEDCQASQHQIDLPYLKSEYNCQEAKTCAQIKSIVPYFNFQVEKEYCLNLEAAK